jgi:glutathione synthase/RimK-type ligase-like ATP-grasp enzyme
MTIAILGGEQDRQVRAVADALTDRDVEVSVWDADNWPGSRPLSFAQRTDSERLTIGDRIDTDDLDAVYYRRVDLDPRTELFGDDDVDDGYARLNQLREYRGLLLSILRSLESAGIPVVNPAPSMRIHGRKPYQLSVFADAGLPIPETLTTNDPDAVRAFVDEVGDAIFKPVAGGGHARPVDDGDLDGDRLSKLANAPVQFQERLDGDVLRLFVVDGDVVATGRIVSDELDYRQADHDVVEHDPGPAVRSAAVKASETLGLRFSGVDVIVEPDRFGLLEANPSPMFAGFDDLAGTDVAEALAAYLVSHT